ncbi:MAG: AAA family ATPase [Candidatus Sericytochromatia bacterium]|nr:AAA family ATPase [Candidatus Sericytochromatia bacterium]
MKLKTLRLTHYRGARDLQLSFNERLNIFYGVNGSGKSTVLDALAIMLSWAVSRVRQLGTSGRAIRPEEITNSKAHASVTLKAETSKGLLAWKLVKNREGHIQQEDKTELTALNEWAKVVQQQITDSEGQTNLPIFVHYSVNRAVLDIPLRIQGKHSFRLLATYDEALTSGSNFRTFFEWFREREDLENENRKYEGMLIKPDDYQFPDPQLEAVRSALGTFLPEFSNLTVRRKPLRMEVQKQDKILIVNQLSDGEKCLIALIGDLAQRLAIANPNRANPLEGEGVVLIDEIDLHLHPKWQRMVVPRLLEVFPNCQFMISTHSPHVLTQVPPEHLFLLTQTEAGILAEHPRESYGKNVDRILEDLMGLETTRPDKVQTQLDNLYQAIADLELEKARSQMLVLQAQMGSDPELVKAEVLIKRKEILGK